MLLACDVEIQINPDPRFRAEIAELTLPEFRLGSFLCVSFFRCPSPFFFDHPEPEILNIFLDSDRTINDCNSTVTVVDGLGLLSIVSGSGRHCRAGHFGWGHSTSPPKKIYRGGNR